MRSIAAQRVVPVLNVFNSGKKVSLASNGDEWDRRDDSQAARSAEQEAYIGSSTTSIIPLFVCLRLPPFFCPPVECVHDIVEDEEPAEKTVSDR